MSIDAKVVMQLRSETGAAMMDCKKALEEAGGDKAKALEWLRKKNLASGEKKQDRAADEGALGAKLEGDALTVVELSANTDFVVRNEQFKKLLDDLVALASAKGITSAEALGKQELGGSAVNDVVRELAGKIGENIGLKRVLRFTGAFGYYLHHDSKQGAVVELEGASGDAARELGKDLAMHVVFAKPEYLKREEVPAEQVQKEKAFISDKLREDPKNAKKPPEILDKIADGQIAKFFGERCLLDQPYFRENKMTVTQHLQQAGGGAKIKKFTFLRVGN
ncbi:MAG: translation elongation factor Ts [Planctomycetes bacterium]|nr:translation elongation factor Ts [Planctomycetota bacterium]